MNPTSSSDSTPRSGERRRNPRHSTRSIIYAEFASGNGGIIVNLGIDGLAFYAAVKLAAERNSTLNFRLRGDGLNAELCGDIVWLSATQKEAGVRFQALSGDVRQNIADWIARQGQVCEDATSKARSLPRSMPAMPGTHAREETSASKSSSAVPGTAAAVPAAPLLSAVTDPNESRSRASLYPVAAVPGTLPPPATILADRAQDRYADSVASPEQPEVELPPELPVHGWLATVLSKPTGPSVPAKLGPTAEEYRSNDELPKKEQLEQVSGEDRVLPFPASLRKAIREDTWIPRARALLAGWRQRNRRQKLLIASTAAGCLWILVLIFILTVMRIPRSPDPSVGSGSLQQAIATPVEAADSHPEIGPSQAPTAPPVTVQPQPDGPWTSSIASFFEGFLPKAKTPIDKSQNSVQVWISKGSGYYYCAGSPYYEKVQPGAFMSQGDALQSGYQPKLGDACN